MKKIICLLLVMLTLLSLCACGKEKKVGSNTVSSKASSAESDITVSEYTPDDTSSEQTTGNAKAITRYYLYGPGKKLKTTYDVDYSAEGTITINHFDKNNYKTGSYVLDYDENGLVTYFSVRDKDGKELNFTTYDYNNLMKLDAEYYYEQEALRSTTRYFYNSEEQITGKTVEKVGEAEVYTWEYARSGDNLYGINISTDSRQNFEGYNFVYNPEGRLYQKFHIVNHISADYHMYDYDKDGDINYRGYFNESHELIEYYEFSYGKTEELAAKAFKNSGLLD